MNQQDFMEHMLSINIEGHVIPHAWFNALKFENGKVDLNSIVLLSEIVYWYRPVADKDKLTGEFKGYKTKFDADKLQRSYKALCSQFGLTTKQVREALKRLEDKGLVKREFRNVNVKGKQMSNAMFISLDPIKLKQISGVRIQKDVSLEGNTPLPSKETPSFPGGKDVYKDYYTEIYKEIVSFLNQQTGKAFKHTTPKTQKLIRDRLKEGNTVDDFKQVIRNKVASWKGDPKWDEYLRPVTLFSNKFEGYLNKNVPANKKPAGGFAQFAEKGDDPSDKE
ncbi:conserved phage C-terminal domain-containing protein [Paenalkalicoccus suaedae]|uniref:Conserved phage C-terminal domain-containing protein n=1 Tax=Paenalkalicoccus suaedae TaxID=2592382 RepID=A0A859FH12_9BACI|nr:conserved phage C-terminal domain-containing protein [Paenalkalicoccus suaedae]QKS71934.1 conserved phage C-terminal domain-containing protein [Paenalkalicoccus suaedae]